MRLIRRQEVARILGISEWLVVENSKNDVNFPKPFKLGKSYRWNAEEFAEQSVVLPREMGRQDLADFFDVNLATLRKICHLADFPKPWKEGHKIFFSTVQIIKYVKEHRWNYEKK